MHNLSVQDLQDIAVRCTARFLSDQTPLNNSLAKEAADLSLNSEQVKRAVEATNTLTYLKTLEKAAGDRTPEFPVADYVEIMKIASVPENSLFKEAEQITSTRTDFIVGFPEMSDKERIIGLHKQAQINARALEDDVAHSGVLVTQLVKAASVVAKDITAVDKMSAICGEDFEKLAQLVFKEQKPRNNTVEEMFKEAELKDIRSLASLYKEAQELLFQINKRQELQKRAQEVFEIEKQAGIAQMVAGGIGKGIGKVVGPVVKSPFKAAGALGRAGVKKVNNVVANTSVGKALGVTPKPISTTVKRTLAAGSLLAGAGMDAALYKPKQNPDTGNGGDVWKKLHGDQ